MHITLHWFNAAHDDTNTMQSRGRHTDTCMHLCRTQRCQRELSIVCIQPICLFGPVTQSKIRRWRRSLLSCPGMLAVQHNSIFINCHPGLCSSHSSPSLLSLWCVGVGGGVLMAGGWYSHVEQCFPVASPQPPTLRVKSTWALVISEEGNKYCKAWADNETIFFVRPFTGNLFIHIFLIFALWSIHGCGDWVLQQQICVTFIIFLFSDTFRIWENHD